MRICAVYRITCVPDNERCYIGATRDLKRRWKQHRGGLRSGTHSNHKLQAAWNRFGESSFRWRILQECSASELRTIEDQMIEKYGSHTDGYQLSHLGAGLTTEGRLLLSSRMIGNTQTEGLVADSKSEEGRRRRSETMKRLNATGQMRFKKART